MITGYVTIPNRPEFMRNVTGFGYMVRDIASGVGSVHHVDVLCTDSRGDVFFDAEVQYLKRSFSLFFMNALKCLPIKSVITLLKKYNMQRGSAIRLIYYWLMTGYMSNIIKKGGYDIVHIHGCDFSTDLWMKVCESCNQKFIVTLHGLNSFSDTVGIDVASKQYERDFLKRVVDGEFSITVISSGMRRNIEKAFGVDKGKNISVVCNSFSIPERNADLNIRKHYGIPQEAKILLYVGNISHNKNQEQMVRAYNLLPEEVQNNTYVLFCGADHSKDGVLQNLIEGSHQKSHLVLCGSVDKETMANYYQDANGVVLLSYAEGFGLSLVEGMYFGLPCAMHKDLDAFEDIYNERCVVCISDREDESVANSFVLLLYNNWDSDVIKAFSGKFERSAMAKKYIETYSKVIKDELL